MTDDSLVRQDETIETLFGGRLKILQKRKGYRYSIDAILLACFVNLDGVKQILELGAGSGVISLVLAFRYPEVAVTGLEIQENLADMARRSVLLNGLEERVKFLRGDAGEIGGHLQARSFQLAVFNPPYRKAGSGRVNRQNEKSIARHEITGSVDDFLRASAYALVHGGRVCLIFPCSRMVEALHRMRLAKLEPKRLRMVHSRPGSRGEFILVEGVNGGGEELSVAPPLYIYDESGSYAEEMGVQIRNLAGPSE